MAINFIDSYNIYTGERLIMLSYIREIQAQEELSNTSFKDFFITKSLGAIKKTLED